MDHPERILKVCLMDIVPNHYVWTHITKNWVIGTWHWGFMAQPEPFPERLISAVPAEYFLKSRMVIRGGTGLGFLTESALAEYVRCYTLKTITGSCRDYRATATCDFAMDTADKDKKLAMPLLLLWGARGHPPERAQASSSISGSSMRPTSPRGSRCPCGHYMQEEMPDEIYAHYTKFFAA